MRLPICLLYCLLLLQTTTKASVTPVSLFSDHMVLQQGVAVPVWGAANDNEKITVSFHGQTVSTIAKGGKWMVKLKPLPYISTPEIMTIKGDDNTVAINDVLVGEVWLCSGQSNMERQLGPRPPQPPITNWEQERDAASYPSIREYYVPLKYAAEKVEDVHNKWTICSPQTVSDFSAVGYFFVRDLYQKLHVPVGFIFSAFGGTPAEDWTSKAALEDNPQLTELVNNYNKKLSGYQPAGKTMSGLYNGMIYPLIPYAIKGVAWYQGENNNYNPKLYREILPNMIRNWRKDFNQGDFPFLIVQIAPHKDMSPELREAQLLTVQKVKNTALIVTTDCGEANEIHPPHKQPVGERLALAAEALAYRQKVEYSGPVYQSYKAKGNAIVLSFTHVGKGLSGNNSDVLKGFTITGADKQFVAANAKIEDNKVVVWSDSVSKPVAVRYGWAKVPDVNLYNSDSLPASPFRTDVE